MKKRFLLFLQAGLILGGVHAQNMEFLDVNHVKAGFWADGAMFWDKVSDPLFEWPKDSGTHINYVTGLCMGGIAPDFSIHGAFMRYQSNGSDYWPGPLTLAGTIDSNTSALYNKVWKISKTDIVNFRECKCINPNNPVCNGYQIPPSILLWPGNPILEADGDHTLMDPLLAPFHDDNGDGIYSPLDCDYPEIKCDQALFYVFNDKLSSHGESFGTPMGVEVRALAYACACDTLDIGLDDAIFLDLDIRYRGTTTLQQTYIGLYSDADIGGANDDYIGTHVDLGYVYHYNADAYDSDYAGTQGYGAIPPAHAIVYLEGPWMNPNGVADYWSPAWNPGSPPPQALSALGSLQDTLTQSPVYGINGTGFNDTIADNEKLGLTRTITIMPNNFDPVGPSLYYQPLTSVWPNSTPLTFGGTGYGNSTTRSYFIFPYENDSWNWGTKGVAMAFNWSEFNTGAGPNINLPNDRRSVSSSGPVTLHPGQSHQLTFCFASARSTNPTDSLSLGALETTVTNIRQAYFGGNLGQCVSHIGVENEAENIHLRLFPNPTTGLSWLSSEELPKTRIQVFDLTGRLLQTLQVAEGQTNQPILTETYSPGMYLVVVEGSGWRKSLRLVKN